MFKLKIVILLLINYFFFFSEALSASPTNKDYGGLPAISLGAISPSGNLFAYRNVDGKKDLFVVYSRTEKKVISAAHMGDLNPYEIYFIDENKIVLIAAQIKNLFEFRKGYEFGTAFVYDIQKKEFKQLLKPGDNIYIYQTWLGRVLGISADKKFLFMPAYIAREDRSDVLDFALMKVNIDSPQNPRVHVKSNSRTRDFFIDEKGNVIAKETYSNSNNKHTLAIKDGSKWREIYKDYMDILDVNFVGIMPNKKSLMALFNNEKTGRLGYYEMSLIDGAVKESELGRVDADIDNVFTDINRVVLGVGYSGFNPSYHFFDPIVNARVANIVKQFPEQSVILKDWTPDWKNILVSVEGSNTSGAYYLFTEGEPAVQLATTRPKIPPETVNPIATVKIKARDGLLIPTLLTIPNSRLGAMKNMPAVLLPHGGPAAHDQIGFDWMAQAFANKGYLVIQPQFRGSAGFGLAHRRAGNGEWGKKMQDDLTDSLQFLIGKGYVDPLKVCIVGGSYGGYAALAGGAFTPDLYKCVVSINGVSDLTYMLRTEKRDYGKSSWIVSYWEKSIANGKTTYDFLDSNSPVNFADKYKAPVLLIHGENDETVPIKQSKLMYKALKSANKKVVFKELENENHYLLSGETRLEMLESMVGFVEKHLGH